MSTYLTTVNPSSGFIDRCKEVFSNSDNIVEGTFWGGLCGLSVKHVKSTITKRQELDALPENHPEKAQKIWNANKEILGATCTSISTTAMLFAWLYDVKLIFGGALIPIFSGLGGGAGAVGSILKIFAILADIDQSTIAYENAQDPRAKTDIALGFIRKMIEVAFYTAAAAWGVFGALHVAIGGAALFALADLAFYYVAILFLVNLGSSIILQILSNKKPI